MSEKHDDLARLLRETWERQRLEGFLVVDPGEVDEPRLFRDETCGVAFRFRWMPHRERRGDVRFLESRGILKRDRDESKLFRDPRDPEGRHCFLCKENIEECHPKEILLPLSLAGREYVAGANFAWIERNHFTVMSSEHGDQAYTRHALEAMLDLHGQTGGAFRVLFNGVRAGASIPWHLHYQITDEPMPVEALPPGREASYPAAARQFGAADDGLERADAAIVNWLDRDPEGHTLNLLIATTGAGASIFFFPRDKRKESAEGKGLVGGFEAAGDFVLSAPGEEASFDNASAAVARRILGEIRPSDSFESRRS